MLGASFLLGGLKHHTQEFNRAGARMQAGMLFLATIALLIPSAISKVDSTSGAAFAHKLSVGLAVLLITAYGLGMLFSLKTHRELFGSASHGEEGEEPWPIRLALGTLTSARTTAGTRIASMAAGHRVLLSACRQRPISSIGPWSHHAPAPGSAPKFSATLPPIVLIFIEPGSGG